MWVCICHAKDENDVKREGEETLAGTGCGTCLPEVKAILERNLKEEEKSECSLTE